MTHIVAGFPSIEENKKLVKEMEKAGTAFIEIQIPFSDPIADGPIIMDANQKSLENGTTTKDALSLMEELTKQVSTPLLFMTYFNIIFNYGVEKFCKKAKEIGCYGLIIPDFPIEEEKYDNLRRYADENELILVEMLTPYTSTERTNEIIKRAKGMIYCST